MSGQLLQQSDPSIENGPSPAEAQIGFLIQSKKKSFFYSAFFDEQFDWQIQSKKFIFSSGSASRKSKVIRKRIFEPIASLISPQNTHPHAHTPIPGTTQQHHTTAPTLVWLLSLLLLLAASQRGAYLASPASSVYHTMAAARGIDVILPTTVTLAVT